MQIQTYWTKLKSNWPSLRTVVLACAVGASLASAPACRADRDAQTTNSDNLFEGRWDLTIHPRAGRPLPSWIELQQTNTGWSARFVGRWGNARPLPRIEVRDHHLQFTSPAAQEGSKTDLDFEGDLIGDRLKGTAKGPDGEPWTWTGVRAPELKASAGYKWGKPIQLFNGRSFAGWTFDNPAKASSWVVENGSLVNTSAGSNLATRQTFNDFILHIEVNCPPNANSGIYLRGRYEVQVEDDSVEEPPSHHMGAVYGFLAPTPEQPRRPGVWQSFDITLIGRRVTVVQNGQTIIDQQEIPGITGGAIDSNEGLPGPIYLQGDHGGIAYRNIVLTPTKR
ncbi:MAG TPA: DUF1080 domain-containing protein [Verrucomicrobiae bacterium]|nr:DUF1080 domain-containing protein [Verrucomicrobiae bacterium]